MIVHKAYRYEVEPTAGQLERCRKHVGVARFVYNWGLARRIEEYRSTGKSSNAIAQHRQINKLKDTDFPWMREVSKCAPQEALRDLDSAYKHFFRRVKQGKKPGFPKFKKRGVSRDSCRFTGSIKVLHRKIQIPKLGKLRTKESTDAFDGRILNATLSREADRWFVALAVEVEMSEPRRVLGPTVGIDLGINCFVVTSENERIEAPKPLLHAQALLAKRQRRHSRKQKGSNNRRKSALCLARLHRRVRNVRNDFLHKLTTTLAKTKSVLVVEGLSVQNMLRNRSLAKHIADAGWAEFRRQLTYKTTWYGSELVVAPKFYPSSKTCSRCGHVKAELSLAERTYTCSECDLEIDRDLNAARNLATISTRSSRESNACGDGVRPKRRLRPKRRRSSMKRESTLVVSQEMTKV